MKLRDYQEDLYSRIGSAFRRGVKRPLVVSPTGSGKTVLFCEMARNARRSVIIVVHRHQLVTQVSRTLTAGGIEHGCILSGKPYDATKTIHVAMVQTLAKRVESINEPNLIVVDEAHHCTSKGAYADIINHFPAAYVVGFTATPERLDGYGLSGSFSEIILGPAVEWLMANGYLARPKYYSPPCLADPSTLRSSMGDYSAQSVSDAMDRPTITGDAIQHYRDLGGGQPAIAFCATINHAEHVAAQFNSAGIKAATISSRMDEADRDRVVRELGDGTISVLTSCDIVSEGFDLPIVSVAILLRHTKSLGLHLQQIGRILRLYDGKQAVVLDHVGNLRTHGIAEQQRDWTLDATKRKGQSKPAAIKTCPQCYCCHSPAPECPECLFVYPVAKPKRCTVVEGRLEEFRVMPIQEALKQCRTRQDVAALAKIKGYKRGWVYHTMNDRRLKL